MSGRTTSHLPPSCGRVKGALRAEEASLKDMHQGRVSRALFPRKERHSRRGCDVVAGISWLQQAIGVRPLGSQFDHHRLTHLCGICPHGCQGICAGHNISLPKSSPISTLPAFHFFDCKFHTHRVGNKITCKYSTPLVAPPPLFDVFCLHTHTHTHFDAL